MTNRQLQTLSVVLAGMFIMPACFKLLNVGIAVEHFATWGLPLWLMHFIGASELAGAIGLLVPRTRLAAAFSLFLLMVGGLVTHLVNGEYRVRADADRLRSGPAGGDHFGPRSTAPPCGDWRDSVTWCGGRGWLPANPGSRAPSTVDRSRAYVPNTSFTSAVSRYSVTA